MDAAMEKKLQEMLDRQEIWTVLQRYGRGLDRRDRALARSIYHDDAIDDHGMFIGLADDFIDWADGTVQHNVECHHGLMNHVCELDGDDAHSETYYLFIGVMPQAPHLMAMGRYIDHWQRRNGEWKIANRVNLTEKTFSLQDAEMGEHLAQGYGPDENQPTARDRSDVSYQRPLRVRLPRS